LYPDCRLGGDSVQKKMPEHSKKNVELSVVIVNYRTPHFIIDCLETLLPELSDINSRVVIVDNHSNDDSLNIICSWLVNHDHENIVLLLASDKNAGFSAGNNIGIQAQSANFYLLLNSDTLVHSGAVEILLQTADRYTDAGLISPRLEWEDGKGQESCFRFHSPVGEFLIAAQTSVFTKFLSRFWVAMPVQTAEIETQWTSFACVLIRSEVIDQIGLLDDGFFMYFEDEEFCLRATRAGWKIIHNPDSHVVHLRGGSSPVKEKTRLGKRVPRYFYESRTRFLYLAYGWAGLAFSNLLWWVGRSISKVRSILGNNKKHNVERRWLDIWINFLNPLKAYTHPDDRR